MTQGSRIIRKLRFSRRYLNSSGSSSSILRCSRAPVFARSHNSGTISTSSPKGTCSNFSDAFSEENKDRLVRQLGRMRIPKSLVARCSEEAAVFVPFCLVNSIPSLLFTLRSSQLNSHRGEVSFPGGKRDPEDNSMVDTAVREMEEELGLERSRVQVWAQMPAFPDRVGKTAVTPVIGFLGEIDMNSLKLNPKEVESVFTLSLAHLSSPQNHGYTKFTSQAVYPLFLNGPHKIWGLTAIVLEQVLLISVPESFQKQFFRPVNKTLYTASMKESGKKESD